MSNLLAARAQMGMSLAFHIIFSALGVGLPLLLCLAEGLALKYRDPDWMLLTRRWTKAAAILFAIGAVSGTILSFELGLLWPTYTKFAGAVVGLPFALEGFAFFLEAIFLGLYLYGWDRLSPLAHWLCSFPIWISGLASAWFIVSVNSWMNTPAGFVLTKDGRVIDINPWQAMFNPATPYETIHMMLSCYVATGFAVAAVYAWTMLHGKRTDYYRKALLLAMAMGAIAIPLQIISGDANARFLAQAQPTKLAAMEGLFHTGNGVPLRLGGLIDPSTGQVYYAIEIPHGLSFLATGDPNGKVQGLDAVPRSDWPILEATHLSFDGMVACGMFALFIGLLFWFFVWRKKRAWQESRLMLWGILLTGPLSFLAIELGWMVTEFGRQPWVIVHYLRTANAVTTAPGLNISFLVFSLIYVLLSFALIRLLIRHARSPFPAIKLPWSEAPYQLGSEGVSV
jgi:cytochrome bd ubiquinol oxidase subunit I